MKLGKLEIGAIFVGALVVIVLGAFLVANILPVDAIDVIAEPWVTPMENATGDFRLLDPKVNIGIFPGGVADNMSLVLENGYTEELTVSVSVITPDGVSTDNATGLEYSPAPLDAQNWIVVSRLGEITIPPASIINIPVRLTIPKDAKNLPERWEFDVKASEGGGFVTRGYSQRYLITMR